LRLKKHLNLFVKILIKILEQSLDKRYSIQELNEKFNGVLKDKRLSINTKQLSSVIKQQDQFKYEKDKTFYEFTKNETYIKENF